MVNVPSTAQDLCDDYKELGLYIGLAVADDENDPPGPPVEVGVAGYERQSPNWRSLGGGVIQGDPLTFSLPAGYYTYMTVYAGPAAGSDDLIDWCEIDSSLTLDGQQIVVTPVFTQT
jgi:hypothetical protein